MLQNRMPSALIKIFRTTIYVWQYIVCSKKDNIINYMDIRKLAMVQDGAVPLYTLDNGTRYKYVNFFANDDTYTFVKHAEYEFPPEFRLVKKNVTTYLYKVAIPESLGYQVIFVDETAIVKVLEFP
jgi:hypothetical protein